LHARGSTELKGRSIRVKVLSPGQVDTPDSQRLDEETREMFESLIQRGKMGRPEEIATVSLLLASDDSSFVNGVDLSIDGGFSDLKSADLGECVIAKALTRSDR
jgi:NAD(P)-dependent dehydrogenase (short-subunit alcohol dehydrogenase family)